MGGNEEKSIRPFPPRRRLKRPLTIARHLRHRHARDNLAAIARHTQDNPRRTGGFSGPLPILSRNFPTD